MDRPTPCSRPGEPTAPGAARKSWTPSTNSPPPAKRSPSPPSRAPRESTARSSTDTTTYAHSSSPTPTSQNHHRPVPGSATDPCSPTSPTSAHNQRLRQQNTKLTERLSETLGTEVFHTAGLGGAEELQTLRARVTELEEQLLTARHDLQDQHDDLDAARTANRDLITTLNTTRQPAREQHL